METSSKKRIIILSATGILLTGLICLFISRNIILCHIVDKRTTRIEQAYGLQIHYQKLQMEGCNKVVLQGLSIIPNQRDTLLTLQSVNVKLSFWKLLKGEVEVRNVHMDGLAINFIKYDSLANYDFLFLKRQQETESKPAIESNYANRIDRVLNLIYGFLPENGQLNQIKITERKDSNFVAVNIPSFVIKDNHFQSTIQLHLRHPCAQRGTYTVGNIGEMLISPPPRSLRDSVTERRVAFGETSKEPAAVDVEMESSRSIL